MPWSILLLAQLAIPPGPVAPPARTARDVTWGFLGAIVGAVIVIRRL